MYVYCLCACKFDQHFCDVAMLLVYDYYMQQVYMYYGPRSNAEFLLNNGFLYPSNASDRLEVRLGFSKTDPLYAKRCDVLARFSLLP